MIKKLTLIAAAMALTACGTGVEVPPAYVGKKLTKNGYAPETIPPSKFRLDPCFRYCDKLVLLEAADTPFKESLRIFMPKDELNLAVDVRGTMSIPKNKSIQNFIYDNVTASESNRDATSVITTQKVYNTYGLQALRGIVRAEVKKYTIADIITNTEDVTKNVHQALINKLAETNTPIHITRFEFADIQPPSVIVDAKEAAKKREIDIMKAEADAEVLLVEAERALEVAKKDRLVEREKAEAIAEQNRIAAKSITPEVLAYKKLEADIEIFKEAGRKGNLVILPSTYAHGADAATLAKLIGREVK